MPGWFIKRAGSSGPRTVLPSLAVAGVGAAVIMAAAAPAANAAPRPAGHHHKHASHALKRVAVKGLVAAHHGRTVTVFAKRATAGKRTHHNRRIAVTFARSAHHARVKMPVGDRIHVAGLARVSGAHMTIVKHSDETVMPAPASLFVGTVSAINGNLLTVREQNSDNGDDASGSDSRHGDDGTDRAAAVAPADRGTDNSGPGHNVTVDITNASTTVDGSTDTPLSAGDTVAILGENSQDTIVADQVFGFTNAPAFLRGDIAAISGDTVTLGDDNQGEDSQADNDQSETTADDQGQDDSATTVSLAGVPLVVNGSAGATTADLAVGDKLVMLGSFDTSGTFTPSLAFAFNSDDNQPCGHNDQGDDNAGDSGTDD